MLQSFSWSGLVVHAVDNISTKKKHQNGHNASAPFFLFVIKVVRKKKVFIKCQDTYFVHQFGNLFRVDAQSKIQNLYRYELSASNYKHCNKPQYIKKKHASFVYRKFCS